MFALVLSAFLAVSPSDAKGTIPIGDFDGSGIRTAQELFDMRIAAHDPVILFQIDSHGGLYEAGTDFAHHVRQTKGSAVVLCVVNWKAYSMGFLFLEYACDQRIMTSDAMLMAHGVGAAAQGNQDEIQNQLNAARAMNDSIAEWVSNRLNMSKAEYLSHTAHNEWWMSSEEALRAHAIDSVVSNLSMPAVFPSEPKAENSEQLLRLLLK